MPRQFEVVTAGPPPVWAGLRNEAERAARDEPTLASLLNAVILSHDSMAEALSYQFARKIADQELRAMSAREIAEEAYEADPSLITAAEADLRAVFERDPACKGYVQPFLFFKGFQALQNHRVAHWLWTHSRDTLAFYLQSRGSEVYQVDIHPNARIGSGVFLDHGTGIVIGETAVVGDDVSMLHGVTLGGTGAERGDRHPKIGRGVLLPRQGARQYRDRRVRQGRLRLGRAQARAAPLHGGGGPRSSGELPDLRRAGAHDGPHPGRGGLRLRHLTRPLSRGFCLASRGERSRFAPKAPRRPSDQEPRRGRKAYQADRSAPEAHLRQSSLRGEGPQAEGLAEVELKSEFIGVIYEDEDEPGSFLFEMAILAEDLE